MGVFSTFFRQLSSKKEEKRPSTFFPKNGHSENEYTDTSSNNKVLSSNSSTSQINTTKSTSSASLTHSSSKQNTSREGRDFKYNEDGRRYHGNDEVAYILPNDDDEADRVHQQHWIFKYALQCNYHAPVTKLLEEGITVLDSGCGPATWTFEMGETYPRSNFHGIDVSFVFPENIKPANVDFVICNIAKDIPYPDNTFDYIHQRFLLAGLTSEDWEGTLKELYRVLKPGGYVELVELDMYELINMGPLFDKLRTATAMMFSSRNIPPKICTELENRLIKAGFINLVLKVTPLAVNHTGKAGTLLWEACKHGHLNMRPVLEKIYPEWEDSQAYESYLDAVGLEAKKNETCFSHYVCYGQKPLLLP